MKNLAIIPARSGSKGLKNKNIRDLAGKPLIAYSIDAALKSRKFDTVMVSTDSEIYAEIGKKYGAEVPFLRSKSMASDTATTWDAIEEVLDNYDKLECHFDSFTVLQPTSPLRTADDIIGAAQLFNIKHAVAVVSVCEMEHSPLLCNILPADGSLDGFISKENNTRRQNMDTYYRLNGAIYIVRTDEFRKDKFLYRNNSFAYIMDPSHSIDIDIQEDFEYAEVLMNMERNRER